MTQMGEYEAGLRASYAAARARLMNPAKPLQLEPPQKPEPVAVWVSPSKRILAEVCDKHGVTLSDIKGEGRTDRIICAKQEAYYRLKAETRLGWAAIARRLNKDERTVVRGAERHQKRARLAA